MSEYHETPTTEKLTALALELGLEGSVVRDDESTEGRYIFVVDGEETRPLGDSKAAAMEALEEIAKEEPIIILPSEEELTTETQRAQSGKEEILPEEEGQEVKEIEYPVEVVVENDHGLARYVVTSPEPFEFGVVLCNKKAIENKEYFHNEINAARFCSDAGVITLEITERPE